MKISFPPSHTGVFAVFILIFFWPIFTTQALLSPYETLLPLQEKAAPPLPEEITIRAGETEERLDLSEFSSWMRVETQTVFVQSYRAEIESGHYCATGDWYCDFALSQRTRASFKNVAIFSLEEKAVEQYLEKLNQKIYRAPRDATFAIEDNRVTVFDLGRNGIQLDTTKSLEIIRESFSKPPLEKTSSLTLLIQAVEPSIQSNNAASLGLIELIGEGRTNFAGSPKNRIHNFTHGAKRFHGLLIKPGEVFSFVDYLGPVDKEHGYLPELVIKHNKTTPEFGGGICQVSTTAFRAAINSGLKIVERRNHAYPVQYYKPYGMDATIYIPKPDLRFTNNTPGHILIQTAIEGQELIFRFYGTSDGREVTLDGPHILSRGADGAMKTVFNQKVTGANGETLFNDSFYSNYASPNKYPHPGQEPVFTSKPDDWSESQWRDYKRVSH